MKDNLAEYMDNLKIGRVQKHKNLAIYPLILHKHASLGCKPLDEAMQSEEVEVEEINEEGMVEELAVTNRSKNKVLILEGEQIVGLKQNRIFNVTVLVGEKSQVKVPVSCVEQGRWHRTRKSKAEAKSLASCELRATMGREYTKNMKYKRLSRSDQSKVWSKISDYEKKRNFRSPTKSYHDFETNQEAEKADYMKKFKRRKGQVGLLVFINNNFASLNAFHHPELEEKLHERVVSSCVTDALNYDDMPGLKAEPSEVLNKIKQLGWEPYPSFGMGEQWRVESEQLSASALVYDNQPVHLSVHQFE